MLHVHIKQAVRILGLLACLLLASGVPAHGGGKLPDPNVVAEWSQYTDWGLWHLQRTGESVSASFTLIRSPRVSGQPDNSEVLVTVPPEFRPPFPILRWGTGQWQQMNRSLVPYHPDDCRFHLEIDPAGNVRYANGGNAEVHGACSWQTKWGTTPVANDAAILEILGPYLDPPWWFDPDKYKVESRVTALGLWGLNLPIPPELLQLGELEHLFLESDGLSGPQSFPADWGKLSRLTSLYVTGKLRGLLR